jgi:hypothetical protein
MDCLLTEDLAEECEQMPWEVIIQAADGAELGDVRLVREKITTSLPGIEFYMEPSGAEKIAAARAMGVEFPDVIRNHLEQRAASLHADFEGDGFSMQFYGFESQPLQTFYVDVRGSGNPLPALAALCRRNGWVAIECANRSTIGLTGTAAAGWDAFQKYRDNAISRIIESEESD